MICLDISTDSWCASPKARGSLLRIAASCRFLAVIHNSLSSRSLLRSCCGRCPTSNPSASSTLLQFVLFRPARAPLAATEVV